MTRTPPVLDEALVQTLSKLASEIDGSSETDSAELVKTFNAMAGTHIPYLEFQGVYGAEEHDAYVRRLLTAKLTKADPSLDRTELIKIFTRITQDPADDAYLQYAFTTIEKSFGDSQVSDLVFWPNHYFDDGSDPDELTPEQMADAVLDRYARKGAR
ncbi:hypothetical protein Poly24_36250 [Rosistilla carotiformis]|uniref:Uncharacterized protein n=1 Tax=Rosistilla carotiformis TaxID=2528017 RepID=A0A518JWI6_9BACT|nr:hypothetical protein [Rosistilla carotiformis]QDV69907.1 hypothetical protein Poly24_36250 [Rosistilla carotiformis]